MADLRDYGVTVEEYLNGLANGIDLLELRRLESHGIPTNLALEVMKINKKRVDGTATHDDLFRALTILTPSLRKQLINQEVI